MEIRKRKAEKYEKKSGLKDQSKKSNICLYCLGERENRDRGMHFR